jgi:hypothetical protein
MAKLSTDELLDAFKEMTLIELTEFVKQFEETFGVSAAAPVAVAARVPPSGGGGGEEAAAEQDEFDVILEAAGDKKIQVIKEGPRSHEPRSSRRPRTSSTAPRSRSSRRPPRRAAVKAKAGPRGRRRHGDRQVVLPHPGGTPGPHVREGGPPEPGRSPSLRGQVRLAGTVHRLTDCPPGPGQPRHYRQVVSLRTL